MTWKTELVEGMSGNRRCERCFRWDAEDNMTLAYVHDTVLSPEMVWMCWDNYQWDDPDGSCRYRRNSLLFRWMSTYGVARRSR